MKNAVCYVSSRFWSTLTDQSVLKLLCNSLFFNKKILLYYSLQDSFLPQYSPAGESDGWREFYSSELHWITSVKHKTHFIYYGADLLSESNYCDIAIAVWSMIYLQRCRLFISVKNSILSRVTKSYLKSKRLAFNSFCFHCPAWKSLLDEQVIEV